MVTINRIYTRTGDDGTTGLVGGTRVEKTSPRIAAVGDVDGLNARLGVVHANAIGAAAALINDKLFTIQNELFDIGAELGTQADSHWEGMLKATNEHVTRLESWIDELNAPLPPLRSFVLPGGSPLSAELHVARVVCRQAEISILHLHKEEPVSQPIREYINRLSDLLFVMARAVLSAEGKPEYLWAPGSSRPILASR